MALQDFKISKCVQLCESSKSLDRKKGMKDLLELVVDPDTVQFLNDDNTTKSITWSMLYSITHNVLLSECDKIRTEESKGTLSITSLRLRQDQKKQCVALVGAVVRAANRYEPRIKYDSLLSSCLRVFNDHYLQKNFLEDYMSILLKYILHVRKNWCAIQSDQWNELLGSLMKVWNDGNVTPYAQSCIVEALELVVRHGSQQSHLIIAVKHDLLPFLCQEMSTSTPGMMNLLALAFRVCSVLAKECRSAVCLFGEKILGSLCESYNFKIGAEDQKNSIIVQLLLLQFKCHHPKGARKGIGGSYAFDWKKWNNQLLAMYRIVAGELQRCVKKQNLNPLLLNLAVELCNQLFADNNLEVTLNDSFTGSASKRRRIIVGFDAIMDELQSSIRDTPNWSYLALLSSLLKEYPKLLTKEDLHQLLKLLCEMQCNCKDSILMSHICQCSESLLQVADTYGVESDVWIKIWETTLRTIGLNQCEEASHSLLQLLILKGKVPPPGLESLLRLFQSCMIKISPHSLQSLLVLCKHHTLPETQISACDNNLQAPFHQPPGEMRILLLEWLLPVLDTPTVSNIPKLAEVLVALILRIKPGCDDQLYVEEKRKQDEHFDLEDFHLISAFQDGLVSYGKNECERGANYEKNKNIQIPMNLVDLIALRKLEELLQIRCEHLRSRVNALNEGIPPALSAAEVMKTKIQLSHALAWHATLLSCTLSNMLQSGVVKEETLQDHCLCVTLSEMIQLLGNLLPVVLAPSSERIVHDAESVTGVLSQLSELYGAPLALPLASFLRNITPQAVVFPIYKLFTTFPPIGTDNNAYATPTSYDPETSNESKHLFNFPHLSDSDNIHGICLQILSLYSCPAEKCKIENKQLTVIKEVLKGFIDYYNFSLPYTLFMVIRCVKHVVKATNLCPNDHLSPLLKILQSLCRLWNQDAEASSAILSILRDVLDVISAVGGRFEQSCAVTLLKPFMKRTYGPHFTVELLLCLKKLIHVDSSKQWARWKDGTNVESFAMSEDFPPEASNEYKDKNGSTAIVEELVIFLKSEFHEVRLMAVSCIVHLFTCVEHQNETSWQHTLFARILGVSRGLFMIQSHADDMNREERIDESSDRTATVLHMLASVVACSSLCRMQALFSIVQLIKLKDVKIDLVKEVVSLLSPSMNVENIQDFLVSQLTSLLNEWLKNKYPLKEFPWQLFGYSSWLQFFNQHKRCIVPTVLQHQDKAALDVMCEESTEPLTVLLQDCFSVLIAQYLPAFAADDIPEYRVTAAKKHYSLIMESLGKEKISHLMASQLGNILIEITKLIWDPKNLEALLGVTRQLPLPAQPYFSHRTFVSTLQYLQKTSNPDIELLIMVGCNQPSVVQHVLMHLRADVCSSLTLDQRLFALYHYCVFVHALARHLQERALSNISVFVVRDVSHTLMHLVQQSLHNPITKELGQASCRYLRILYEHILPVCVEAVSHFLPTIVSLLVPLAQGSGPLALDSLGLLQLLVVSNEEGLKVAISQLPPFPEEPVFDEMRRVHRELKYRHGSFTLEQEIAHFLRSFNGRPDLEGLQFLRKELSNRKHELQLLYRALEDMRGFSEDCATSVLHQLICTLVNLASSSNSKISWEAAGCLGELGPADLTTLVLRPTENCVEVWGGASDALVSLLVWATHLLTEYLVDPNIRVVEAVSTALYSIMSTAEAQCQLGLEKRKSTSNNAQRPVIEKEKLVPFLPQSTKSSKKTKLTSDTHALLEKLRDDENWQPGQESTHETWVVRLVTFLFRSLADENSFFAQLIPLCHVKVSFAENILPYLLNLGLTISTEVCAQLCERISEFFSSHSEAQFSTFSATEEISKTAAVYLNRASVQCMLNAVNFIRLQGAKEEAARSILKLNYLHIAQAAQFCNAHFSSIMYAELWCDDMNREKNCLDPNGGSSLAPVDYICEANVNDGDRLQTLLREAYKQIGDQDAVHGCGSSMLLNPATRVEFYAQMGMWDQVLLQHDMRLHNSINPSSTKGLAQALHRNGLLHLLTTYMRSLPKDQTDGLQGVQLECMWRLGHWTEFPTSPGKECTFEWHNFSALKGIRDGDRSSVNQAVTDGRLCVLRGLAHASLESCNSVYGALSQLRALQEIDDVVNKNGDLSKIIHKWNMQDAMSAKDFQLVEPILAQRAVILQSLMDGAQSKSEIALISKILMEQHLNTAKLARTEGWPQVAEQSLHSLAQMPHLPKQMKWLLLLEQAQLAWSRGGGAVDTDSNAIARQQLRSLLMELKSAEIESDEGLNLHSSALRLYATWLAESHSENPQVIIDRYLEQALNVLESSSVDVSRKSSLQAHRCLAHFADMEYQRVATYMKSEIFINKQKFMESIRSDAEKLKENNKDKKKDKHNSEELRAARVNLRHALVDEVEISNVHQERDRFLLLAMKHYLRDLIEGEGDNLLIFRFVSLWLENRNHEDVGRMLKENLPTVPSHKFVVLLPQLTAHIGDNQNELFTQTLHSLLMRCAVDHPHHTLPLILALANSHKDQESNQSKKNTPSSEPRVLGAARMISELRKHKAVGPIVAEMEKIATALISFAYLPVPDKKGVQSFAIPKGEKIRQLQNLECALLPVITLPVRSDANYENTVGIYSFEDSYSTAGGINQPKKVVCIGTDGVRRPTLVKGKDDLRQDAVMQQVFAIMNTLLRMSKETQQRKLLIRTYKIVPLTQRSGVIEWCQNTAPLGGLLMKVHSSYYPEGWKHIMCRKKIEAAASKNPSEKLRAYKEVCKNFHPAFRYFFNEKFPTAGVWFERRLAYTLSVATNSMVGYILGLGDRHVQNILVDQTTAEVVHIDFGIAFEQGRILPTPETVPFRLSRDIEDGMGVSGIEGVFRRSCEKTMRLLRSNQETILTILGVLLYDPLYAWTITPKKAASRQSKSSRSSPTSDSDPPSEGSVSNLEVNKMAERALLRLQQKLQGTEDGPAASIEGQVNRLIQQARDPANLSQLYHGWQAYF